MKHTLRNIHEATQARRKYRTLTHLGGWYSKHTQRRRNGMENKINHEEIRNVQEVRKQRSLKYLGTIMQRRTD
jgi:hypothetical protein